MSLYDYNKNKKERQRLRIESRELVFTTPELIRTLLDALLDDFPYLRNMQWHDIVAADGRWENILRNEYGINNCRSSDIVPLNDTVEKLDLFSIIPDPNVFYFGNLPFSRAKDIYYKFKNCHRLFIGGRWFNKFGGKNYNFESKLSKCFKNSDDSNQRVMFTANYSRPYEPMPANTIISGYEKRELPEEEKKKYLFLDFKNLMLGEKGCFIMCDNVFTTLTMNLVDLENNPDEWIDLRECIYYFNEYIHIDGLVSNDDTVIKLFCTKNIDEIKELLPFKKPVFVLETT